MEDLSTGHEEIQLPPGIRRTITVQKASVSEDPPIDMFFNFLNDAEISYILSKAEGLFRPSLTGVAPATVMDAATTNRTALLEERTSPTRTSFSCVLDPDDAVVRHISERVAYLAGFPASHVERLCAPPERRRCLDRAHAAMAPTEKRSRARQERDPLRARPVLQGAP